MRNAAALFAPILVISLLLNDPDLLAQVVSDASHAKIEAAPFGQVTITPKDRSPVVKQLTNLGTRGLSRPKVDERVMATGIPVWSDSFDYRGLHYGYSMVGTDPRIGSATTTVPVTIIPLRFVFADGHVYDPSLDLVDGQQQIPAILNSPIFQDRDYVLGGTDVGNTQLGDAFQRANFWNSVSTVSPNYHVRLDTPIVAAQRSISVPFGYFDYFTDPATQQVFPEVDLQFLGSHMYAIMQSLGIDSQTLSIFMTGQVSEFGAFGFHTVAADGTYRQVIVASYLSSSAVFRGHRFPDIYVLSHEILEWLDNPYTGGTTPGWNFVGDTGIRCVYSAGGENFFEVADPFTFYDPGITPIQMNSKTYHVTDAAFVDFFTRGGSRSVNGQYSLFASVSQATPPCLGLVQPAYTYINYPGAVNTYGRGINNAGTVAGYYQSADRNYHGFVYKNGVFTPLDQGSGADTRARGINDAGTVVGSYKDPQGATRGFLLTNGQWVNIDFPQAAATIVNGINTAGSVAGSFTDKAGVLHGFVFRDGAYQRVQTPKQSPGLQVFGINDANALVASASTSTGAGPFRGFSGISRRMLNFTFPESSETILYGMNSSGDLTGEFTDANGYFAPIITIFGDTYFGDTNVYPYTYPHGYNDLGQFTGDFGDPQLDGSKAFIGQIPLATLLQTRQTAGLAHISLTSIRIKN